MCCQFAPGLVELNWASKSRSGKGCELFVTLSGKAVPRPFCWRGWKGRSWIRHLFGAGTFVNSMESRGVGSWISSLAATRASRSRLRVEDLARLIHAGFGPTFSALCEKSSRAHVSLRTSQTTFDWASEPSETDWKEKVSALRADCLRRRKLARRTSGSGCSSWPTAKAMSGGPNSNRDRRANCGGPDLQEAAAMWATPNTNPDAPNAGTNRGAGAHRARNTSQCLTEVARSALWPTAGANDYKGTAHEGQRRGQLDEAAEQKWQTPTAAGHPTRKQVGAAEREDLLPGQAANWQTPRSREEGQYQRDGGVKGMERPTLTGQVQNWATPNGNDWQQDSPNANRASSLKHDAPNWATPMAMDGCKPSAGNRKGADLSHQAQGMETAGRVLVRTDPGSSPPCTPLPGQNLRSIFGDRYVELLMEKIGGNADVTHARLFNMFLMQRRKKLNPRFVEWLMGVPIGWTSCADLEMPLSRWVLQMRLCVLLPGLLEKEEG